MYDGGTHFDHDDQGDALVVIVVFFFFLLQFRGPDYTAQVCFKGPESLPFC